MIRKSDLKAFVDDLKSWGRRRIKRVAAMTKRYGVICHSEVFSDGKAG